LTPQIDAETKNRPVSIPILGIPADIGKDLKLSGDISIKNKQATIILKGKF
jgi:hypothetical protein